MSGQDIPQNPEFASAIKPKLSTPVVSDTKPTDVENTPDKKKQKKGGTKTKGASGA